MNSYRDPFRSTKYEDFIVEPVPPTWRDCWAIIRGRYVPTLRTRKRITMAGTDRVLKQVWTADALAPVLSGSGALAAIFNELYNMDIGSDS